MFILRSFYLSIFVALRMVPVLIVTGCSLYYVINLFRSELLALIMIVGVIYLPLVMFLYLSALRAGLTALRASGPPILKKLWQGTIRLMRFQFMLSNMVFMLVGIGGTVVFLVTQMPETWDMLRNQLSLKSLLDPEFVSALTARIPMGILVLWAFALSMAAGLIGVSAAATGAFAAERGPNHDMLWGVTEKFLPIFVLSAIVLVVPTAGLVMVLGGPMAGVDSLLALGLAKLLLIPLYLAWAFCVICAGKALAYVQAVKDTDARFQASQDALLGEFVQEDDLRSLRIERQRRTEM